MREARGVLLSLLIFIELAWAGRQFDVRFLDLMIESETETVMLTELAQERSSNPELKKLARLIGRENRSQLKKLQNWRSSYFSTFAPTYLLPSEDYDELQGLRGGEFDVKFLLALQEQQEEGRRRLLRARRKGEKAFIITFAERGLKLVTKRLRLIRELLLEIDSQIPGEGSSSGGSG